MTHTLRRSRSKYGRTRRQRKKQLRMQGGGIFDDFVDNLTSKFKPKSSQQKCQDAKEEAEKICNSGASGADGDIEMSELNESAQPQMIEPLATSNPEMMPGTSQPASDTLSPSSEAFMPASSPEMMSGISQPEMVGMEQKSPVQPQPQPLSAYEPQTVRYGGAKKSKKKNKKQSQRHRKKLKSRKHKK